MTHLLYTFSMKFWPLVIPTVSPSIPTSDVERLPLIPSYLDHPKNWATIIILFNVCREEHVLPCALDESSPSIGRVNLLIL